MTHSQIRLGVTSSLASLLLLGGCMFVLDTEKLQEGQGGSAGQGGDGGGGLPEAGGDVSDSGGSAGDAGPEADAAPQCTDDFSCLDDDPCSVDTCDSTGKCVHSPHHGLAIVDVKMYGAGSDNVATVQPGVDSIGVPVLTTDGDSFVLGYWYEVASEASTTRDVVIKRFPGEATVAPDQTSLRNAAFALDDLYTSPALLVRDFNALGDAGAPARRIAVIVGGQVTGAGGGVYVRMLNAGTLAPEVATIVPLSLESGLTGDDFADPTSSAPAAISMDDHMVVTWVRGGQLHTWDARLTNMTTAQTEHHTLTNEVTNAIPIQGTNLGVGAADFGAVLETKIAADIYSTDLWSHGNDGSLKNIDPSNGARLGIAAAAITDPSMGNPSSTSIAAWSYLSQQGPAMFASGAMCGGGQCNAVTLPSDPDAGSDDSTSGGMYPSASSVWIDAVANTRAIGVAQVLHTSNGAPSGPAFTAVLATAFGLQVQGNGDMTALGINPGYLLVRGPVESPSSKPEDSPYGRTAIAVTKNGSIMVAWLEAESGKPTLRARRYATTMCQ